MIARIIEFSVRNRALVLLTTLAVSAWGVYCLTRTPVDAIPDLSENQVIVWADWEGRSPREVEDQITYPLSVNLQGLAGVKTIRAASEFGFSMITVIFDDHLGFYFARERVLERLSTAATFLPAGVVPYLASDATALGQIFWYTVEGEGKSLDELRALQDWYVRYQLFVPGVAEVASVGGFIREYQIDVDPGKLRTFDVTLAQVFGAVQSANSSVGGKVIQKGGSEYLVRGHGWIRDLGDVRSIVVTERNGVPITVEELGTVQLGPAFRRGVLEKNGREAVGGVVMMRHGENPLQVIERVKERIQKLQSGLPSGVRIVPFYDRTGLIHASIHTLTRTLIEEIAIASLVVFLVLWHFRSAMVICVTMPLAVLVSFIFMYYFKIPSNIMSLTGIAISIGVLVDAGIVMTENAYNRLQEHFGDKKVTGDTSELVIDACKVVGGPLFFSIVIMILSFAPVFVLGGLEGKMFNPLAYTKTFALLGVALFAITLVPALLPMFVRGRLRSQEEVWLVRSFVNIYKPLLEYCIKHPDVIVVITGLFLIAGMPVFPRKVPWTFFVIAAPFILTVTTLFVAKHKLACFAIFFCAAFASFKTMKPLGEEFMPTLDELSIMDMPVTQPSVNITQATGDIKARDAILRDLPEVHQVVGKLGRAETPTDPAPIDMVETIVTLRPKDEWPKRKLQFEDALKEAEAVTQALVAHNILSPPPPEALGDFHNTMAMEALTRFDREVRGLCLRRLREHGPARTRDLLRFLRTEVIDFLRHQGLLERAPLEAEWLAHEEHLSVEYSRRFDEWILLEDVTRATNVIVERLIAVNAVKELPDLLVKTTGILHGITQPLSAIAGIKETSLFQDLRVKLEAEAARLRVARIRTLNWEIEDRTPAILVRLLVDEALAKGLRDNLLPPDPTAPNLPGVEKERVGRIGKSLYLWRKLKNDIRMEMDSELQVPGWSNIWTQPIINRIDMLSTGVRTQIGIKLFGTDLDDLQRLSNEIAVVLKTVRGAADVNADQIVGENYLEISIDRQRAARYGVRVEDIQDAIEMALGGKQITMTVEGRRRFPVRVRYPREARQDEESVKNILVAASASEGSSRQGMEAAGAMGVAPPAVGGSSMGGGGMGNGGMGAMKRGASASPPAMAPTPPPAETGEGERPRLRQVPLSLVADVRIVPGPSMIKSENGLLRTFVSLNVRERDIVGFVEEAEQQVAARVRLPEGYYIEWSGQFEHQLRAQKTLTIVLPLVILVIFILLYLTYRDFSDTLLMFLAIPGAVAGGAIFQYFLPKLGVDVSGNFSVAVWIGYIACFGLATETSIVMLVYLREAIARRGGMEAIQTEEEIRAAVIEGAVHRLRPKILTEATTLLALIPMLWATGVGAEYMRPMAAPILGGILVADEVIDVLIPVLFYWERRRRLRKRLAKAARDSVSA